jgi:hypothetical protein
VLSDVYLFWLMTGGLRGQHFPVIIAAARKWMASAGTDFCEISMQALVPHWRKCTAIGGDYVERYCFVAERLLYSAAVL